MTAGDERQLFGEEVGEQGRYLGSHEAADCYEDHQHPARALGLNEKLVHLGDLRAHRINGFLKLLDLALKLDDAVSCVLCRRHGFQRHSFSPFLLWASIAATSASESCATVSFAGLIALETAQNEPPVC